MNPVGLKSTWYELAKGYDKAVSLPKARLIHTGPAWQDQTFYNTRVGIERLFETHPDFFEAHDYDWTLQRDSYDYTIEAYYQYIALHVLIGNWYEVEEGQRSSPLFKNICVRVLPSNPLASPRLAPEFRSIRFIVVPSNWDFLVASIIEGFLSLEHINESFPVSQCARAGSEPFLYEANTDCVLRSYKAIVASRLCEELIAPHLLSFGLHEELFNQLDQLAGGQIFPPAKKTMTPELSYSSLSTTFSIAHEIGHALNGLNSHFDKYDSEKSADIYAYAGLWKSDVSDELADYETDGNVRRMLAGLLFMLVLAANNTAARSFHAYTGKNIAKVESWESRYTNWEFITRRLITVDDSALTPAFARFQKIKQGMMRYVESLATFCDEIYPPTWGPAQKILSELKEKNLQYNDPRALDELLDQYMAQRSADGKLPPS